MGYRPAQEGYGSIERPDQAVEELQHRRLAGSIRADEGDCLAYADA
jgi:hypothetical protein